MQAGCAARDCCIEKGLYACYECDQFESCDKLRELHGQLHYDACLRNMRAMREQGLAVWLEEGPRYCYWMEDEDEQRAPSRS